jgi:enoyl-CoA hydratase/carnithine racemase
MVDDRDAAERDADEQALAGYSAQLVDAVDAVVAGWVLRCVEAACRRTGVVPDDALLQAATEAARRCRADVVPRLRALLALDVDEQPGTPLQVLREAVRCPTEVLVAAGVPADERDEFEQRAFPDDVYGLTPAGFADVDPSLQEPGLTWGAAKAHVHLRRHR